MDLGLHGKAAIITGGSMGLVIAITKELARESRNVCICARNEEHLAVAKQEIQGVSEGVVCAMCCDVVVPEDIAIGCLGKAEEFAAAVAFLTSARVTSRARPLQVDGEEMFSI